MEKQIDIKNKKAFFEFEFLDRYPAGVMLTGTEIKSVRLGNVNMSDAWCYFSKGELFVKNLNISPYEKGTHYNHEPLRPRKLLLRKKELEKLQVKIKEKGLTIIPTRVFLSDRGLAKIEVALAKGKKLHDKRDTIKMREAKRELQRINKMH
ncbi:MAG: SsrA-binding protein SmpB [Chitinophagales bacterium]|nr:SsrA-binding protein SmpB [Bacteroidota bacterium]MBX7141238.1 SsrA-binding protein SmpB [Chitinophagales bacterium]